MALAVELFLLFCGGYCVLEPVDGMTVRTTKSKSAENSGLALIV